MSALSAEAKTAQELGAPGVADVMADLDGLLGKISSEVWSAEKEMNQPLKRLWRLTKRFVGAALLWFVLAVLTYGQTTKWKIEPTSEEKRLGLGTAQLVAWLAVLSGMVGIAFNTSDNPFLSFLLFPFCGGLAVLFIMSCCGMLLGPKPEAKSAP